MSEACNTNASGFIKALETGDLKALRAAPKSDLHNHGCFGASREIILEFYGIEIEEPPLKYGSIPEMDAWYEEKLPMALSGGEGLKKKICGSLAQADRDGVSEALLSFGGCVFNTFGSADAFANFVGEATSKYAPRTRVGLEYCLDCRKPLEAALAMAKTAIKSGKFCALDALGLEGRDPRPLIDIFMMASDVGMRTSAHLGEFCGPEEIEIAVETLGLGAIQHGLSAAYSVNTISLLVERGVVVNVCPTSNLRLGRVDSLSNHPIRAMVDAGMEVTIASDDVLLFDCEVSTEYLKLYESGVLSADELNKIRLFGLDEATALFTSIC